MSEERGAPHVASGAQEADRSGILQLLYEGEMELLGLLPWSTNYTFLASVRHASGQTLAVYKPQKGERPLWDFPRGTLCLREYAAFLVSEALGWMLVPPTVLREGPHGLGMVQLYIDAEPDENYFTFRGKRRADLRRLAAFDVVVNNADRKGGHCLLGKDGRLWAIDHGITFHAQHKLRTVIWDFAGQPLPSNLLRDLHALRLRLEPPDPLVVQLAELLLPEEMRALRRRVDVLLETRVFPKPGPGPNVPWPPV